MLYGPNTLICCTTFDETSSILFKSWWQIEVKYSASEVVWSTQQPHSSSTHTSLDTSLHFTQQTQHTRHNTTPHHHHNAALCSQLPLHHFHHNRITHQYHCTNTHTTSPRFNNLNHAAPQHITYRCWSCERVISPVFKFHTLSIQLSPSCFFKFSSQSIAVVQFIDGGAASERFQEMLTLSWHLQWRDAIVTVSTG